MSREQPALPHFSLPELDAPMGDTVGIPDKRRIRALVHRLQPLTTGEGALSEAAKKQREAIRQHVLNKRPIEALYTNRRNVRLLVSLIRQDDSVANEISVTSETLNSLDKAVSPISPNLLRAWILCYFERYDNLEGYGNIRKYIHEKLQQLNPKRKYSKDLTIYRANRLQLFDKVGPNALVETAITSNEPLEEIATTWHIPKGPESRFFTMATHVYFVETLKSLHFGQKHSVMQEILKPKIKESLGPDGLLIGQHATKILIERCLSEKQPIPETWRDFILSVCGDPRAPRSSPRFTKWWASLDSRLVDAMRRWLSKLDLNLFLEILEQIAKSSRDSDMKRMFPARKRFLKGLFNAELVHHSRLLLSAEVRSKLWRTFKKDDLPEYAEVLDGNICMIYLDLGKAHLIEGTHNFAVRVYKDMKISGLADYGESQFYISEVRRLKPFKSFPHSKSRKPTWQYHLIQCLKDHPFELHIKPQDVLTNADYKIYRSEFGMT
jgi:hypothetical protein